jgi:hypothetical protein
MWSLHNHHIKTASIPELFPKQKALCKLLDTNLNIFIHGHSGVGKKTMISKYFEDQVGPWKYVDYICDGQQKQSTKLMTRIGMKHMDIWFNDSMKNKRLVFKKILHDLSVKFSLDEHGKCCQSSVVMYNIHHLSKCMFEMLNVTLRCFDLRLILISDKFIPSLASSCSVFRFENHDASYIKSYVKRLCEMGHWEYDREKVTSIVDSNRSDLLQCIVDYDLDRLGIENTYTELINQIVNEYQKRKPKFSDLRTMYYQLIVNNVSTTNVILDISKKCLHRFSNEPENISKIIHSASIHEHRAVIGERDIYHLDSFGLTVSQVFTQSEMTND